MPKNRSLLTWGLKFFFSIALISLALFWIGVDQFSQAWRNISFGSLLWVFFLLALSLVIRGWRAKITMVDDICGPSVDYSFIAAVHNMANQLMPMRSGELAYPYLLKRYYGYVLGKGGASLLYIRFFDLFVLIFFFLVALLGFAGVETGYDFNQVIIGVMVLVLMAVIIWLNLFMIIRAVSQWLAEKNQNRSGGLAKLIGRISSLLASLSEELQAKKMPALHMATGVLTLLNWICLFMIFYTILHSVGVPVTVYETIIGSSVASLAQFIPVSTMGNFGSLEAGWTVGFMMVGVDMKSAFNSGLIMHLMVFLCSLVLAAFSWFGLLFIEGKRGLW